MQFDTQKKTLKTKKNSRHDFVSETNRVCCAPGTWNRTSTQTRLTRLLISLDPRPIHPFTSYLTILMWIGFLINLTSNQCPELLKKRLVGSWLIPSIIIYKPLVFQGYTFKPLFFHQPTNGKKWDIYASTSRYFGLAGPQVHILTVSSSPEACIFTIHFFK